jgi:anti-anti-sigma factor
MSVLTLTCSSDAGAVIMIPHGDLDFDTLPTVGRAVSALPPATRALTLDMSDVPFMDVAGLHLLAQLHRYGLQGRRSVSTVGWRPQPQRVLRLGGKNVFGAEHVVTDWRVIGSGTD